MVTKIWVIIGSGNGSLSDGAMTLHEPILISYCWGTVSFTSDQIHSECPAIILSDEFKIFILNYCPIWNNTEVPPPILLTSYIQVQNLNQTKLCFVVI